LIRSKKSKGFSLIEVLIAIVILSIALLALSGLMVYTTKSNSFGGHMTEATTLAQDKLEQLRVTSWGGLLSGEYQDKVTTATGIEYTRVWKITNATDNLRNITVIVTWNSGSNSTRFVSAISQ
jgi:type IV pilus assembly protein PilV